jgi:hypothetical protein
MMMALLWSGTSLSKQASAWWFFSGGAMLNSGSSVIGAYFREWANGNNGGGLRVLIFNTQFFGRH